MSLFHQCNECRICPKCYKTWCKTSMPPIQVTEENGYIVKRCPDPECNTIMDKFETLETLEKRSKIKKWKRFCSYQYNGLDEDQSLEMANHMKAFIDKLKNDEDSGEFNITMWAIHDLLLEGTKNIDLDKVISIAKPLFDDYRSKIELPNYHDIDTEYDIRKQTVKEYGMES